LNHVRGRDDSLLQNVQAISGDILPLLHWVMELKWPGHEVNHSPTSSANVKNVWSCTSAADVWPDGLDREFLPFHSKAVRWMTCLRSTMFVRKASKDSRYIFLFLL